MPKKRSFENIKDDVGMVEGPVSFVRAMFDIATERARQVSEEGYDEAHDDAHKEGEIALAAASYASGSSMPWPWDVSFWKPSGDQRDNLVKAGALIVADIERIDRARGK